MEAIILDRHSLQAKDYFFTDKDFDIYLDIVVSKISTFILAKESINARVGDLITIKQSEVRYLGIIDSIDIEKKGIIKLGTLEFLNVFALETIMDSYVGNVGEYLKEQIENNFIHCTDYFQSLPYLSVRNTAIVSGELTFDINQLMKIPTLIQYLSKNYNMKTKYNYTYLRGRIVGIELLISDSSITKTIKYSENFIGNLSLQRNSNQSINKVVFIPKEENTQYRDRYEFFLLQNNEITDNSNHELRYEITRIKSMLYSDEEYNQLDIKASNELKSSMYDHNISFDLTLDNQLIVPMKDFDVGDYIEFIHNKDTYKTIVTSIRFHGTMKVATITLGEYRSMLTEKMSLLANKVSEQKTNSNTTIIGSENIDGGEF